MSTQFYSRDMQAGFACSHVPRVFRRVPEPRNRACVPMFPLSLREREHAEHACGGPVHGGLKETPLLPGLFGGLTGAEAPESLSGGLNLLERLLGVVTGRAALGTRGPFWAPCAEWLRNTPPCKRGGT